MRKDKLDIIYQDKDLIIVNKPSNLLTIATSKEREKTMYHKVMEFEKQKHKANKVFVVHRLDKDTSGILMFAKNEKTKTILQNNWDNLITYRGYIALVEGRPPKDEDTIRSWLKENKALKTYISIKSKDAKEAITKYKVIKTNGTSSLLDIEILTGRKNQIRVQMESIGCPIIGDKKYGGQTNKKMYLCAYKLNLIHPTTKQNLTFELPISKEYKI